MSVLPPVLSWLSARSARRVGAAALTLVVGAGLALSASSPAAAARTAHLTGTVTAAGVPLEGIEATAWLVIEGEWEPVESVDTNAAGAYDIGALEPGTYRVGFYDVSETYLYEFWQNAGSVLEATNIEVADGATVAVGTAVLDTYAHITGTVTNAGGSPLGDIRVSAYREDAGLYAEEPSYITYTSGEDGMYDLDGVEAGTYRLEFLDEVGNQFVTEYWNDAASLETADDIDVLASATVANKDAVLARGSSITGTVTLAGGEGAFLAEVICYSQASPGAEWKDVAYTTTDESGGYMLSNLRADKYRVGFRYLDLADEYWNDRPTLESADDITVPVTSTVPDIDAELSETPPVSPVVNTALPTITGQARVGKQLSATPGTWDPADAATAFQWLVNGAQVAGATGPTYQPRIADVGKRISVRVTASAVGYSDRTVTSAQTPAVPKPVIANGTRPKISGKTVVGRKLRVSPGAWTPSSVALTYQWFANGVRVKKAKKSSLVLTAKQVGKRITAKVTASAPGYTPLTVVTARTGRVKPKP